MVEQKDVGKKRKGKQTRKDLATKLSRNNKSACHSAFLFGVDPLFTGRLDVPQQ